MKLQSKLQLVTNVALVIAFTVSLSVNAAPPPVDTDAHVARAGGAPDPAAGRSDGSDVVPFDDMLKKALVNLNKIPAGADFIFKRSTKVTVDGAATAKLSDIALESQDVKWDASTVNAKKEAAIKSLKAFIEYGKKVQPCERPVYKKIRDQIKAFLVFLENDFRVFKTGGTATVDGVKLASWVYSVRNMIEQKREKLEDDYQEAEKKDDDLFLAELNNFASLILGDEFKDKSTKDVLELLKAKHPGELEKVEKKGFSRGEAPGSKGVIDLLTSSDLGTGCDYKAAADKAKTKEKKSKKDKDDEDGDSTRTGRRARTDRDTIPVAVSPGGGDRPASPARASSPDTFAEARRMPLGPKEEDKPAPVAPPEKLPADFLAKLVPPQGGAPTPMSPPPSSGGSPSPSSQGGGLPLPNPENGKEKDNGLDPATLAAMMGNQNRPTGSGYTPAFGSSGSSLPISPNSTTPAFSTTPDSLAKLNPPTATSNGVAENGVSGANQIAAAYATKVESDKQMALFQAQLAAQQNGQGKDKPLRAFQTFAGRGNSTASAARAPGARNNIPGTTNFNNTLVRGNTGLNTAPGPTSLGASPTNASRPLL